MTCGGELDSLSRCQAVTVPPITDNRGVEKEKYDVSSDASVDLLVITSK
jgi:hypothetical protein